MPDTNHQEDIDQNLVQDVDKELESQLSAFFRSKTTSQIEKLCSDHETRLLEIFQRQVEAFNKQKATVLVTMSHIAIQHGASNAVQPHIFKDMEPKSFEFLNKHFSNHSEPVSPTAVPPSPALSNTTSSPQRDEQRTSPSESRADINNLSQSSSRRSTAKRTNTQLPPSGTSKKQRLDPKTLATSDITPVQLQQQLPPRPPVTAEATPMTRPSPLSSRRNSQAASIGSGETPWKNRTLLPTEVEGRDHVFSSPKYGPGVWYVIRCSCLNRDGSKSIPICFTESPFSNSVCSPGEHFNSVITCPGHVTKEGKPYTVDEMMYYWGYTVMDMTGNAITAEWVAKSNEKARESACRAPLWKSINTNNNIGDSQSRNSIDNNTGDSRSRRVSINTNAGDSRSWNSINSTGDNRSPTF